MGTCDRLNVLIVNLASTNLSDIDTILLIFIYLLKVFFNLNINFYIFKETFPNLWFWLPFVIDWCIIIYFSSQTARDSLPDEFAPGKEENSSQTHSFIPGVSFEASIIFNRLIFMKYFFVSMNIFRIFISI